MGVVRNWTRAVGERMASVRRPVALSAAGLAVLAAVGGAWLVFSTGEAQMTPILDAPLDAPDLAAARDLLDAHGIPHRTEGGRLCVSPGAVQRVRGMLTRGGLLVGDEADSFEEFARDSDLWRTQAQEAKRWQAAKMGVLSRLIARFPSVRSATVILEPGAPRKLGTPAVAPTAAVKVTLSPDARMTQALVKAIADLVAGSVSGMRPEDVCVVDNVGFSYRVGGEVAAAEQGLGELRAAETHYAHKIRSALEYIEGAAVGVSVEGGNPPDRRIRALVVVPRSYLAGIYRTSHPGIDQVTDEQLGPVAETQLAKIQQAVMHLIGSEEAGDVKVDWYHEVSSDRAPATAKSSLAATSGESDDRGAASRAIAAVGCGLGGLLLGVVVVVRRRRLVRTALKRAGDNEPENEQAEGRIGAVSQTGPPRDEGAKPFAFLDDLDGEQLGAMVHEERPQTIALILTRVGAAKAAIVLGSLPRAKQVEVVRCLASADETDPQVLREVERGFAARAAELAAERSTSPDGLARVAEILHQAGYQTERAVLAGLSGREPELAESIRGSMFAFEDIARVPVRELRVALESIESDELAVALRTAGREVRKRVFSGLSAAAARRVRGEMARIGPVRLSNVEAAQQRVVEAIRVTRAGRYVSTRQGSRQRLA